jgi:hypothetical protein
MAARNQTPHRTAQQTATRATQQAAQRYAPPRRRSGASVTVDFGPWRDFVAANKIARKPADDYYALTQLSGPPTYERECALLTKLLWDAEEVGAVKLSSEVNVEALVVVKKRVPLGLPGSAGITIGDYVLSGLGQDAEVRASAVEGLRCNAKLGSRHVERAIEAAARALWPFVLAAQP